MCFAKTQPNQACTGSTCVSGYYCKNNTCQLYGAIGAACTEGFSAEQTCQPGLKCISGMCGTPLADGQQCSGDWCRNSCDKYLSKCTTSISNAALGTACGQQISCAQGLSCKLSIQTNGTFGPGVCVASTAVGDGCFSSGLTPAPCSPGQQCTTTDGGIVSFSEGRCALLAAGTCCSNLDCPTGQGCGSAGRCGAFAPMMGDCSTLACSPGSTCKQLSDLSRKCLDTGGQGQNCSTQTLFSSQSNCDPDLKCVSGKCYQLRFPGGPCDAQNQCVIGLCKGDAGINSVCGPGDLAAGASCQKNSECDSLHCFVGVCKAQCN
jgi:hypothetical protein